MTTLLAKFTVLLRRHPHVTGKGAVETAAGAETGGEGDIQDGLVGIAQQRPHVIDTHGGNVLLHGLLHHSLEYPHRIVRVELNVLGDGIDGQRLVVVGGDKFQHLADIKLRMARDAVLMGARGFVDQNRLPAGEAQPLQHP